MDSSRGGRSEAAMARLVAALKRLPGIGEKTATRLAHHVLRQPPAFAEELAAAIHEARQRLQFCEQCCTFSELRLCLLCTDPDRSDEVLCVVEQPADVAAFERTQRFRGKYHVLHGALSPLEGIDESRLRIRELERRIKAGGVREVILATNPTVEGDTTSLYLSRLLKQLGVKTSRIAHGIPVGAEIEYLDGATLGKALENRTPI